MLQKMMRKYLLNKYIKQGLQIGDTSVILGKPSLGSEPFLISIGENVTVTSNVKFITHDGATRVFRENKKYQEVIKYGRIVIEDNCFIGMNSIILPGVIIGENSVVAAGSIVNKSVPRNSVVGGNPAKIIMTTDEYAEKCLNNTPNYDKNSYKTNKKEELIRIFPRPW